LHSEDSWNEGGADFVQIRKFCNADKFMERVKSLDAILDNIENFSVEVNESRLYLVESRSETSSRYVSSTPGYSFGGTFSDSNFSCMIEEANNNNWSESGTEEM